MAKSDFFWQCVVKDIVDKYKIENPSKWGEEDLEDFLDQMNEDLKGILYEDKSKARKCGVPFNFKGEYNLDKWEFRVDIVTWRRYIKYEGNQGSKGNRKNRNCFAILLGYDSAQHYLEEKARELGKEVELEDLNNETEDKPDTEMKKLDSNPKKVKGSELSATNFKAGKDIDVNAKQENSKTTLDTLEAGGNIKIQIEQQ